VRFIAGEKPVGTATRCAMCRFLEILFHQPADQGLRKEKALSARALFAD
jgi:hypothetical protein